MNDPKIDNRLKEIEDEIILLSGHLSDAVEKKIAVKIGDLKEGLEKFQKTVMAIPAKKGAPIAPALEYNKIQNDLDTIRKIIGSDEMDKEDDNLVRRIETFSGILMKGLVNLETNVQDSVKQSSEAQENVKASLIDNINRLNETIENVRSALTTGVGESVGGEINGIKSRVDSAAAELINNLNDVLKSVENIELQIQNSVRQTDEKQAETRTILLENLNNLNTTAVSIQRTLSIDEDKTLGTEISDIRNRIDELSEELTDNSSTLKKGIDALDTTIRDSIKQSADKLDETSELLIQNLTGLNQSTDSIRQLLTIDKKKTLGTEIAGIQSGIELISNEVSNSTGSVKKDISE
ncbi:MAG: hypothetical protein JXB48_01750, partial [Candidatus Latescibacteria bacterium]|nr:hypothetical protein [Candidatus Latescibacterota bacterium]